MNPARMKPATTEQPATPADWASDIASRVNTYGIGLWLKDLATWIKLNEHPWLPQSVDDGAADIPVPVRGLQLRVYPLKTFDNLPEPFRLNHIVLQSVFFNGRMALDRPDEAALPFGLDPASETPESARRKLAVGEQHVLPTDNAASKAYSLADGRLVEIVFGPRLRGVQGVWVARQGEPTASG